MKKNLLVINRALAIFMALITVILSVNITSIAAEQTLPEQVVNYYKNNDTKLDSWWELVAINGAGENLKESPWEPIEWKEEDYPLDAVSTSDYVGMILGTLAKNDNPEILFEERNIVNELIDKQNQVTGQIDQWLNLHIWAMIALNQTDKEYNDDLAVDYLLSQQKQDGGFNIFGDNGDPDITGMALLALAPFIEEDSVEQAVSNAIIHLKSIQNPSGGFSSWGTENSNSIATVISGLIAVGEDIEAAEWLKNGNSMIDALLSFQLQDKSFSYDISGQSNASATAQALIAINDAEINTSTFLGLRYQEAIENNININLCVEGSEASLINKNTEVVYSDEALTAMDALKQALTKENIEYNITSSAWGEYINSIGGDTAGKFGGWDGWLFAINGEMASVGADSYLIQENDQITFYYGMYPPDTYFPEITIDSQEITLGQNNKLTVATSYFDWNTNSQVEKKLQGIKIEFNNKEYITDIKGEVILESPFLAGEYICNISKENAGSYPGIVRQKRIVSYIEAEQSEIDEEQLNENDHKVEVDQALNLRLADTTNPIKLELQTNSEDEIISAELPYINTVSVTQAGDIRMTIPAATRVEAENGWDGTIALPRLISNSLIKVNNANVNQIIEVGSTDYSLSFDKPVRLVFPNLAGKAIGFADKNGNLQEITSILPADTYEEAEKLQPGKDARIDVGNDLIVWTKHFTKFVAYTKASTEGNAQDDEKEEISITVKGYDSTMLGKTKLAITANETAYSALAKAVGSGKIKTKGSGSDIYVIAINNLAEFDKGPKSGWMYKVNGISPNKGAGSYKLKAGDNLIWYYTSEIEEEEELEPILPAGDIINTKNIETEKNLLSSYLYNENPTLWSIFALAKTGKDVEKYKAIILNDIIESKGNYNKATDLAKIILVAGAAGLDAEKIENINLVEILLKYEKIDRQGVTGPIFGLLALNSASYKIEDDYPLKEGELFNLIISYQNKDGGFSLYKDGKSSIDITAMALQALAYYKTNELPENAGINKEQLNIIIENAVSWLSKMQLDNGGFNEWGVYSSESISQVIIALASLEINPLSKEFIKEKGNLISALMSFSNEKGGYVHVIGEKANEMASEQALMAYEAYSRLNEKTEKLFEIADNKNFQDQSEFSSWSRDYIMKSSKNNLMTGIKNTDDKLYFIPQKEITRAEFTTVLIRLLGEEPQDNFNKVFKDIEPGSWYENYIYKAYEKGIIKGTEEKLFSPEKNISREEMATMINRAFILKNDNAEIKINDANMISGFAKEAVAAVYNNNIMIGDGISFKPKTKVTREMTAVIVVKLFEMQKALQPQ